MRRDAQLLQLLLAVAACALLVRHLALHCLLRC
jgi:hypothetical protein